MAEIAWLDEAKDLRAQGLNYATIARRLDVPYNAVHYQLRTRPKQEKVVVECLDCGAQIERRAENADGARCHSCSRKQGEVRTCEACGESFYAQRTAIKQGWGRYCSRRCNLAVNGATAEQKRDSLRRRIGSRNPNFKHGRRTGAQIRGFTLKAKAEETCRVCGGRAEHAHHAVPRSLSPAGRRDLRNCLPLCAVCHGRWHRGRPIARSVFTPEEWEFVSSLIGSPWLDRRYPVEVTA